MDISAKPFSSYSSNTNNNNILSRSSNICDVDQLNCIESLMSDQSDWKNIQDIIKSTFKVLYDVIKNQNNNIKSLEDQINLKVSKNELISNLNTKANYNDMIKYINEIDSNLRNKISIDDFESIFYDNNYNKSLKEISNSMNSKASIEEVKNLLNQKFDSFNFYKDELITDIKSKIDDSMFSINKKLQNYALLNDLNAIAQEMDHKANIHEMNELLSTKASKDSLIAALQRKISKSELETILNNKANITDLNNIVDYYLKDKTYLSSVCEELLFNSKFNKDINDKIINISNEIYNLKVLTNKKCDLNELDCVSNNIVESKIEIKKNISELNEYIQQLKDNCNLEINNIKDILKNNNSKFIEISELNNIKEQFMKKLNDLNNDFNNLNMSNTSIIENSNKEFNKSLKIIKEEVENNNKYLNNKLNKYLDPNYLKDELFIKFLQEELNEKYNMFNRLKDIEDNLYDNVLNKEIPIIHDNLKKLNNDSFLKNKEYIAKLIKDKNEDEFYKFRTNLINNKDNIITNYLNSFISPVKDELETFKKHIFNELDTLNNNSLKYPDIYSKILPYIDKNKNKMYDLDLKIKTIEDKINDDLLSKISNLNELNQALTTKADLNSMNYALNGKASHSELDKLKVICDKLVIDINNKIDFNKFESFLKENRKGIDDIRKDLLSKATIDETINMFKNKADIDDVNNALSKIQDDLEVKADLQNVSVYNI